MQTTERIEGLAARNALSMIVGIARAFTERAAAGITDSEDTLLDALARIEEHGCQAMPWLRGVS